MEIGNHETHEMHEKWYTNGCTRMRGMCADFQEHECAYTDVMFFQEHELALIDTNAYVMVIWNHEKHETHEMAYTYGFG